MAVSEWNSMVTAHARLERAETGQIGQSPIVSIGYNGFHGHGSGREASIGRAGWASMGGEKNWDCVLCACVRAEIENSLKKRKAEPGRQSLSRGVFKLTGRPARNAAGSGGI